MLNVNPMQLIQLMKNGQNPQQLLLGILQQQNGNPVAQNAANLAQNGNMSGLQSLARNLSAQKGVDFDTEYPKLQNLLKQQNIFNRF